MALYADRVKETTNTTGTGTISLEGYAIGYQGFVEGIGDGETCTFAIVDANYTDWEVSEGVITDGTPDTLTRATVISSSNGGAKIDLSSGTHTIFCDLDSDTINSLADILISLSADANGNLSVGEDDTGYDVTFYGATSGRKMFWDESSDLLYLNGDIYIEKDSIRLMDLRSGVEIGTHANNNDAETSVSIGASAGVYSDQWTYAAQNVFIGNNAGSGDAAGGSFNILNFAMGFGSLSSMGGNPSYDVIGNAALGTYTLRYLQEGSYNLTVGHASGEDLLFGDYNLLLGYDIQASSTTASRELNIGNIIKGNLTNSSERVDFPFDIALLNDDIYFTMGADPDTDYTMRFDGTNGLFDENSVGTKFNGPVEAVSASSITVPLTVKGAVSQVAPLINVTNSSDNTIFAILPAGHITNVDGINTVAPQYGPSLYVHDYGDETPLSTNQEGSYDHTGGTREQLFTLSTGTSFTEANADNGDWIIMMGANLGAAGEIKEWIDADNVIIDGLGWDGDFADQSFHIYSHPTLIIGDGNKLEVSVNNSGQFEIYSYDFTELYMMDIHLDSAANDTQAMLIEAHANGYNSVGTMHIDYISGALGTGELGGAIRSKIDVSGASGADSSTLVASYIATVVGESDATKQAFVVLPGFNEAFIVAGASKIDPVYGYEVTSPRTSATDRVNGGAGDGNAFLEAGNDLEIFDNDDDYVLIGSSEKFEVIEALLTIESSKNITPNFFYSKTGGGWTALSILSDGTNGFQNSGLITFDAPGDWTIDDEDMDTNAITEGYYIAIQRTYSSPISILPTEDYFKTYNDRESGMKIHGDGTVELPYVGAAPSELVNGMIWMESDGLHMYRGGAEYIMAGVAA